MAAVRRGPYSEAAAVLKKDAAKNISAFPAKHVPQHL